MNDSKLLQNVPDSYSDFENCMYRWMNRDENFKISILEQLQKKPDSDTQDLMKILWDYLGIGDPVELVGEDEYEGGFDEIYTPVSGRGLKAAYR